MKMFWTIFFLGSMFLVGFDVYEQQSLAVAEPSTTVQAPPMTMNDPLGIPPGE